MSTVHAETAWLPGGIARDVRIEIDAGRIAEVVTGEGPRAGDERLPGLVLPGLANAHSHAFHRALRGRTHDGGGTFWTWREEMYAVVAGLTPETYRELARAAFAEMVLAGWTAVGEFHYVHHGPGGEPYPGGDAMGRAIVDAAAEAGIRLTLLDTCYLHGGLRDGEHLPLDPTQQRFSDGSVGAWSARVSALAADLVARPGAHGSRTAHPGAPVVGAAAHSARALTADELAALATATRDLPVRHLHLSEQSAENDEVRRRYGCTPTRLVREAGFLGPRTVAVHATHLSDADIADLAATGTGVCVCPTTEADLADGCGPVGELGAAGVPLSLGTDQHAQVDPFAEMRGLELHERLRTGRRGHLTPQALVTASAEAGHTAVGRHGDGRIAVGASADLVAVDLRSVRTAGVRPDQIPMAASAADVTDVVVAGEQVVRGREHRLGDVAEMMGAAIAAVDAAAGRDGAGRDGAGHDEGERR